MIIEFKFEMEDVHTDIGGNRDIAAFTGYSRNCTTHSLSIFYSMNILIQR